MARGMKRAASVSGGPAGDCESVDGLLKQALASSPQFERLTRLVMCYQCPGTCWQGRLPVENSHWKMRLGLALPLEYE